MVKKEIVAEGVHNYTEEKDYIWPEDKNVLERLEWFRDQKLGLMMHWGLYTQLGIVASWALSDEDEEWSRQDIDWTNDMTLFKEQYKDLKTSFNPIRFEPNKWAKYAKDSGFKYLIFTTKHHDGFCMWDTEYTDYKTTSKDCPFHRHKYADICKHVFDAFRKEGLGISAYFSKADWSSPYYWFDEKSKDERTWRGPSYDPEEESELWQQFISFTHKQVKELCYKYGKLDVLWFDAGWVCPQQKQDIRMGELIEELRRDFPGLLCADRTVGGLYENIITPEQCVPDKPINVPWESNITIGKRFAFSYEDDYKDARCIINLLIDVVSKGGNLALNIAPQPDGRLPKTSIETMKEIGEWLAINGDSIYGTRPCFPYKEGNIAFTKKGNNEIFALCCYENKDVQPESSLTIPLHDKFNSIELLGYEGKIDYDYTIKGIKVNLPNEEIRQMPVAIAFRLKKDR